MGIFKTRKNKKFSYTPRYYKGEGNPFEIKHKFDEYRVTVKKTNLKGKFLNALEDLKTNKDDLVKKRILTIALVLVVLFLWVIDFDLSIFFS